MKTTKRPLIDANQNVDADLNHWVYYNDGASTAALVSFLQERYPLNLYPQMKEQHARIEIRPGQAVLVPHGYYKVFSRDDSPVKLKKVSVNDAMRIFPKNFVIVPARD